MSTYKRLRDAADVRARSGTRSDPIETRDAPRKAAAKEPVGLMRASRRPKNVFAEARESFVDSVEGLGGSFMDHLASKSKFVQAPKDVPSDSSGGLLGGLVAGMKDAKARKEAKAEADTTPEFSDTEGSPSTGDSKDAGGFVNKLIKSESGGNSQAEITIKDGRRFVGAGQFGEARLADYKRSTGTSFTQDEFQNDADLQSKVMSWHIADIDKAIDSTKGSDQFDRDGLRAVAHLGGIGGMRNYVRSGGQHNPEDELGTSLSDYYRKFSA